MVGICLDLVIDCCNLFHRVSVSRKWPCFCAGAVDTVAVVVVATTVVITFLVVVVVYIATVVTLVTAAWPWRERVGRAR